jgi:hypothetical protein
LPAFQFRWAGNIFLRRTTLAICFLRIRKFNISTETENIMAKYIFGDMDAKTFGDQGKAYHHSNILLTFGA